jgi:hypothetical protein
VIGRGQRTGSLVPLELSTLTPWRGKAARGREPAVVGGPATVWRD